MSCRPEHEHARATIGHLMDLIINRFSDLFQGTFSLIIEAWNAESSGLESTGKLLLRCCCSTARRRQRRGSPAENTHTPPGDSNSCLLKENQL